MAGILGGVGVAVAYEGALPVVVDVGVGDRNPVRSVSHVNKTIIVILVVL